MNQQRCLQYVVTVRINGKYKFEFKYYKYINTNKMDINVEATIQFNVELTGLLNRLIENPEELSLFMTNFLDNSYEDILEESFDDSHELKYDSSIRLKYEGDVYKKNENKECCICMEKICFNDNVYKCKGCDSMIHYNCMNEWVKTNNNCPMCRHDVDIKVDYNIKFDKWIHKKIDI